MQLAHSNWIRVWVGVLLVLFMSSVCAPAPAQEPQIDALANQMAAALSQAKLKTVIVFDFDGPDEMGALGQKLGEDFRVALTKSGKGLQVQDRSQLLELLKKNDLVPANVRDAGTEQWLAGQTELDARISGELSKDIGGLKITVYAHCNVKSCDRFYEFNTLIPLTDDLKALIRGRPKEYDEFASLPRSGQNGYSLVSCIYCPQAQFSAEALERKLQGTVILEITINEEGHAKDIKVKVGLPYGLTQQAVEAVKEWRFKPATSPDGKPAAVRQTLEVTFHLY
jgi:TonB family protein